MPLVKHGDRLRKEKWIIRNPSPHHWGNCMLHLCAGLGVYDCKAILKSEYHFYLELTFKFWGSKQSLGNALLTFPPPPNTHHLIPPLNFPHSTVYLKQKKCHPLTPICILKMTTMMSKL